MVRASLTTDIRLKRTSGLVNMTSEIDAVGLALPSIMY